MRIVSLVPSVTESLSAWDRTPIACTRFCERTDLEPVGGTKDPDLNRIVELRPDLVVIDVEENRREDYDTLLERGIEVHVLHVNSLVGINTQMNDLANRVDARWTPLVLGESMPLLVRAFVPIWRRPWMALGAPTYGASLLAHLGIATVFDDEGPYPTVELDDAIRLHPDVVLAPSEPYPFSERQLNELETVAPTTFVDGKDLFWWGVRTSDALHRLAEAFADLR
jgi:ABC-type Fe3+-hydroxamate transport system substrate-binding protein